MKSRSKESANISLHQEERSKQRINNIIKIEDKIRNRNNILFICLIPSVIFLLPVLFKFIFPDASLNLTNFGFSDLLATILAFFAISISFVFYFKASDTSNKFYNNTYTFTKDISEKLGRMEERFGQQLEYLNDGYNKVVELGAYKDLDKEDREAEIRKKEKELAEKQKSFEKTIENLIGNTKYPELDAKNLKKEINEKDLEIYELRKKIDKMKENLDKLESPLDLSKYKITPAELKVLKYLVIYTASNREIAERLNINERTVKLHLYNIYNKLGVDNRFAIIELYRYNFT